MAELNPLSFAVAIKDEATRELERIETKLNTLKDQTIKIKIEGTEDLQKALNIDKLVEQIQAAKKALQGNTFDTFEKHMSNAAESVDRLTQSLGKFNQALGENEAMKSYIVGLGEVIRNTNAAIKQIDVGSGGGSRSTTPNALESVLKRSERIASNWSDRLYNELIQVPQVIERLSRQGFDTTQLQEYRNKLKEIKSELDNIQANGGKHPLSGQTSMQYTSQEDVSRTLSLLKSELGYYKSISDELEKMSKLRNDLTSILSANPSTSFKNDIQNAISMLDARISLASRMGVSDTMVEIRSDAYRNDLKDAASLIGKVTSESKEHSAATKQVQKENEMMADSMRRAGREVSDLAKKFDKLEISKVRSNAVKAGVDTTAYDKAVSKMERYQQILDYISKNGGHDPSRIIGSVGYKQAQNDLDVQTAALRRMTTEANSASSSTKQLTSDQVKLSQALKSSNDEIHTHSQILSDLKSLATQYLGVWGSQQLMHNIIEIGGQLEMQRLSIGAILQNQSQANTLFNQIKGLATQSPFGVVELDQMTKQLTAYGFKYNELYDMTKRLADISAATGTGVDRLALALGHVRSEAALSGYTLRQFAMGNVPLLQKLSEKLGKTTQEIRNMVRKKLISYEDVVGVLKELTDDGGMFYNMQEVISESVKAKFKNVKDAMDIMYGEMAEGTPGEALKMVASALMELTRNWKDAATVLGTGAALWGVHRAAVMLYTQTLGKANASTLASIAAHRQSEKQKLRIASVYRKLTDAEKAQLISTKTVTRAEGIRLDLGMRLSEHQKQRIVIARQQRIADLSLAVSEKKLTTEDIARQVALGKLTKTEARRIIITAEMTAADRKAGLVAIANTQKIGLFRRGVLSLSNAYFTLSKAIKATLLSPQMWLFAGITAVMEIWQRNSREMEKAEELGDRIYQHAQDAIKTTKRIMGDIGAEYVSIGENGGDVSISTSDLGFSNVGKAKVKIPELDTSEAKQSMEDWIQYIKDYAVGADTLLKEALLDAEGKLLPDKERFENLKEIVSEIALAQYALQDLGGAFEAAVKATDGGWFDDNVLTDISNYEKAVRNFNSSVAKTYEEYRYSVDKGIKAATEQDKAFAEATAGLDTYAAKFKFFVENRDKYQKANEAFVSVTGTGLEDQANTAKRNRARAEMDNELRSFYINLRAQLETQGVDLTNMTTAQQQALLLAYKDKLESIQGISQETSKELMQLFANEFDIKLNLDDELFIPKINEAYRLLEQLIGRDWQVNIDSATDINDVVEEAQKQYKAAKEYFDRAQPILMKFGITLPRGNQIGEVQIQSYLSQVPENVRESLEQTLRGWNEYSQVLNNVTDASNALGFSLEDSSNKSSEDKNAKAVRERVRVMKEAADAFKYWRDKVGDTSAWEHVKDEFGSILDELGLTAKNINELRKNISNVKISKEYKAIRDQKVKTEIDKEIAKELDQLKRNDFEKATEEYLSNIKKKIDDLTRSWEIFNSVRDATGSIDIAMQLSGAGYDGRKRNLADAIKAEIENEFRKVGGSVDFDINLSDKQIEEYVKAVIPKESEERIKGLIEEYKKWRDLARDVYKSDVDVFTKHWNDEYDREEEFNKILAQYQKSKESLDSLLNQWLSQAVDSSGNRLGITQEQYDRALKNLNSVSNWDMFKARNNFKGIVDKADVASLQSVRKMIDAMREYASTTHMNAAETEAWYEAMSKLTDREAVLDPLRSISDAVNTYNAAVAARARAEEQLRMSTMSVEELTYLGVDPESVPSVAVAEQEMEIAAQNVTTAFNLLQKAIVSLSDKISQLGSDLQSLGSAIGGGMGDMLNGIGTIFNSTGKGIGAIRNIDLGAKGISGIMNKVSAVATVITSVIEINKAVDGILPNTGDYYEKAAGKAREINLLREAVDDYRISVAKANKEENNWFAGNNLSNLRSDGQKARETLTAYYNELFESQEIYKNKGSGLKKWGVPIASGIAAIAGVAATVLTGGAAGAAILGAMATLQSAVGAVTATAIGAAITGGIGAAVGQIAQSAVEGIMYKNGQTSARNNMRIQTRHKSFWRSEKTQGLEDWVKDNLNAELFDDEGLVNLEAAQEILDKYGDKLVGDTKDTLERLVELRKEYDDFIKQIEDYVGNIGSSLSDNMTDALWDWLANGENALDKFKEYASDTWKSIAKDIVKTFMKVTVLDKYADSFKDLFKLWSLGGISDQNLISSISGLSGMIAQDFEASLPIAQKLAETLNAAFASQGYDIAKGSSGSSSGLSKSIQGMTEETSNLLASYLNATRADVSYIRQLSIEYFPMYYSVLTSSNTTLRTIENHTAAIVNSNAAIQESNEAVLSLLNGLRNKIWQVPIS